MRREQTMTKAQVLDRIEAAIKSAGSAQALADDWKVSASYLSDVRAGKRQPGPSILSKMGLTATPTYSRTGEAA
jgi:hypothetical protein